MKRRSNLSRPILTFKQANAICREFLPIGDEVFAYMERLRDVGFVAWVPYHEFIESFAGNDEELEIHRRCLIEGAKNRLGRPFPMLSGDENREKVFFSPYVQQLRDQLEKVNGATERDLDRVYPVAEAAWRRQVDPCERRKVFTEVKDKEKYDARWRAMLDEQRRELEIEAARFATGLAKGLMLNRRDRYECFTSVMEREATALGFRHDAQKSFPDHPVFSKPINDEWDLCWEIHEPKTFFWIPSEGLFQPELEIRSRCLSGSVNKAKIGEYLFVRYGNIVPGFGNAYWKFYALDELETMIMAHLYFYSLMAPIIEGGLQKILGKLIR